MAITSTIKEWARPDATGNVSGGGGGGGSSNVTVNGVGQDGGGNISIGIANIPNLQTSLNGKEPSIVSGAAGQYLKGDKTWADLNKEAVGLGNVDNTTDLLKPISTATQTALDLKADKATTYTKDEVNTLKAEIEGVVDQQDAKIDANVTLVNDINTKVTGFESTMYTKTEVDGKLDLKIDTSKIGVANGVAGLDETGMLPVGIVPGAVPSLQSFANRAAFPAVGDSNSMYIARDTNLVYRWDSDGADYVEISESLALGESAGMAFPGDLGKVAHDHSQLVSGNPHQVTKADVGLGNVDNTTDLLKPISTATQAALDLKANLTALTTLTDTVTTNTANIALKAPQATTYTKTEVDALIAGGGGGGGSVVWGGITGTLSSQTDLQSALDLKANVADVYPSTQVDTLLNDKVAVSDVYLKAAIDTKMDLKANVADVYTKTQSDANYPTKASLSNVNNTSDANKPISTATQTALNLKANTADVYTKTQSDANYPTKASLANVDNTSDLLKPISTATQAALDLKLNIADAILNKDWIAEYTDTAVIEITDTQSKFASSGTTITIVGNSAPVSLTTNTFKILASDVDDHPLNVAVNLTGTCVKDDGSALTASEDVTLTMGICYASDQSVIAQTSFKQTYEAATTLTAQQFVFKSKVYSDATIATIAGYGQATDYLKTEGFQLFFVIDKTDVKLKITDIDIVITR